ncbi:MAG TPA: DUF6603 domain-containing protein [Candidatus Limnocylindrales bacterium]|nr:DUF6603 domain-containing protein [Candidatus Limnocylindrales bacterium]
MSDPTANTIQTVLLQIADAIAPIEREFAPGRAHIAFAELGIPITAAQESAIGAPLSSAIGDAHDMLQLSAELIAAIEADDNGAIIAKSAGLIQKIVGLIQSIDGLVTGIHGLGLAIPPATIDAIPERLFNLLLVRALAAARGVNELLAFLGILEQQTFNTASTDPDNPPYTISTFHFGRLADWFTSPGNVLRTLYKWDDPAFTGTELLQRMGDLLAAIGAPVHFDGSAVPPKLDLVLIAITPKTDVSPKGLSAALRSDFNTGTMSFGADDWKVEVDLGFKLPFTSSLTIQPTGITFIPPAASGTYAGEATVKFIADRTGAANAYILIGQPGGSRLEVRKFEVDLWAGFTWDGAKANGSFSIGGAVSGGKLAISFSEADGFIGKLLSGVHLESDFDFGMGYSTDHGLYFTGASTLEIQLPLHLDLGPVEISAITFSVGIQGQKFPAGIGADIKAALGPLQVVVEQIGLEVDFALKDDRSGNAGPVDISVGFKPPKGAGLSIDAGVVKGGGYLFFDPDKGEYAGVAELSIAEIVSVKAIGLITTKMPDGTPGFSLLLIITTDFPPIQLGFGFTLNAVGGLLGLNRTVLLDVLRDGVRTNAISSIMFPTDVVANAPRIISDLKAIFPPKEGVFLVGPMAKFGWGTPSLVTLSLGLILEIPPGNIAILGILKVALPDEEVALIQLQVNFVGILDFDKQLLSFDASLFDSHILFLTLEGDMAVRLKWGDNAVFVLSVGGFHPSFQPPPLGLQSMKRLTVSILDTDWARIRIENYFAVTSNTVQFGAHAYLFFGVDGCNINGQVGFDVLFQFSPFYFNAMISGSLSLEVAGFDLLSIDLRFSLEGTSPWRAKGTGSISILFFSIDVNFDVTWGDPVNTSLPPVQVMPLFLAEINKQENWRALPPPSTNLLVTLRKLDPALLVLHPFGALTVSQRAMPLNLTLDKLGTQKPDDVNRVDISGAVSGSTIFPLTPVDESFAAAQYQQMSDAEKLSRPSYQQMKGGVTIGAAGGPESSKMTRRKIDYEVTIIDKEPVRPVLRLKAIASLFHNFLSGSAVARSSLSFQTRTQFQPYPDKIAVGHEGYTVASVHDNKALDAGSTFTSEAMAVDYMKARVSADPALAGAIHVLPNYEVTQP